MKIKFPKVERHIIFTSAWIQGRYTAFKDKSVPQVQKEVEKAKKAALTKEALEAKALHEVKIAEAVAARDKQDKAYDAKVKSKMKEGKQIMDALCLTEDILKQAGVFFEESRVLGDDACRGGITQKLYKSVANLDAIVLQVARRCIMKDWAQAHVKDPKRQPSAQASSSVHSPLPTKVALTGHVALAIIIHMRILNYNILFFS
jgi:hypothetical protein